MRSKLFTILFEHNGGTYIAQVRATTPATALAAWARRLPSHGIPGIGDAGAAKLAQHLQQAPPVPLNGLINAWCATPIVRGRLALINIVLTHSDSTLGEP